MQIGKERCEHKAYPHRVYLDRNHIRLCVNGALNVNLGDLDTVIETKENAV